jgi:hypothetical protein
MTSPVRPGSPKPPKSLDELFDEMLQGVQLPLPLPNLRLTPEQVKDWKDAHDLALCEIGEGAFDAVEMIQEQRG